MKIRCSICPKGCELDPGEIGDCRVRQHIDGTIHCLTYNRPCSLNIDPVEKKPLYHFLPGSPILSIGTAGCNLHCKQCQNAQLSQTAAVASNVSSIEELTQTALLHHCPAVAYTYAEPLVSFEYTLDCCTSIRQAGLKNILVTAGYINPKPLQTLCDYVDAANVDLKSFSDEFYQSICDARLAPVLNALKIMKASGVMLEITNLLIPTLNDSEEETKQMCSWLVENLGPEVPLHFSRFFPQHQLPHLPVTPKETILQARETALNCGLRFVYVGNINDGAGESTWCPGCHKKLIDRSGYRVGDNRLKDGRCPDCGTEIYGIWQRASHSV